MYRLILLIVFSILVAPAVTVALPFQFVQEGLVETADGRPLQGIHRVDISLYKRSQDRITNVFQESHPEVFFQNGYYAVMIGSESMLDIDDLQGLGLLLGVSIDQGDELAPRTEIVNVPSAMLAEYAHNVIGSIDPTELNINGMLVIDEAGKWVGDPTGLQGPPGQPGALGPIGPEGPAGPAGGNGSADTPAQVLGKVVQVDGAGSLLDADTVDGLHADRFMRTDKDTGTTGNLTTNKALSAEFVLPQKRIEFPNDGRAGNGMVMQNHRISGVDRLTFNDPGANEGVIWKDTQAKLVVSGLDDENADGALRVINDTAVSLEAAEVLVKGRLKLNGADAIISWEDAANQQGTAALDLVNRNLNGINVLNFNDAGAGEGISWNGSQAKIFVSPLDGSNADGYLRLINDDGISLESHVRVTEQLAVGGRLGVGTEQPESIIHARDDAEVSTGITMENLKPGSNSRPNLTLKGITPANQGAWVRLEGATGAEAGGSDASNHGGLKVITSTGGAGTPKLGLVVTHNARVGVGTDAPRGPLHLTGVDARTKPLVVDGIVPGIYLNDTEGKTDTGARYDSFVIEADGNVLYIGSKDKGQSLSPGSGSRNLRIQNDGKMVLKHESATGIALNVDNGFISGHTIQSNWSGANWSHNLLFNAHKRFTVTQTGPATFSENSLFDGRMSPNYPGGTPTENTPQQVLIEGLPSYHTQAGTWIGWTTRYWPTRRFRIEIYDTYADRNVWKTVADYKDADYPEYGHFQVKVRDCVVNKIRYTFYNGTGTDGRIGVSELFFIHPEAVRPFEGLLAETSPDGDFMKGPVISSNRSAVGLEYNLLFRADKNYTVTQTGPAAVSLSTIFDGRMSPSYSGGAPTEADPHVITVAGLPGNHTQAGTWIGWTTRYWPATRFKIEIYDTYSGRNVWKTAADFTDKDFGGSDFMIKVRDAVVSQIKFTFYKASGSDGRMGISELFFLHPEATKPYQSLYGNAQPECGSKTINAGEDVGEVIGRYTGTHRCMAFSIPANTTVTWDTPVSIPSRSDYSLNGSGWSNGAGGITSTIQMRAGRSSVYNGTTYSCNWRLNTGTFATFTVSGVYLDEQINSGLPEYMSSTCRGLFNVGESSVVSFVQSRGVASENLVNFQGHKFGRAKFGWTYLDQSPGADHDIYLVTANSGWSFAGHGGVVSRSHTRLGAGVLFHDTSRIWYLP